MTTGGVTPTTTAPLPTSHRAHVRSPVDVLRLVLGVVVFIVGIGVANTVDSALLGLSDDGRTAMDDFPSWSHDVPGAMLAAVVAGLALASLTWALITRRYRRFLLFAVGFAGGAALSVVAGELIFAVIDDDVGAAFDVEGSVFRYRGDDGRIHPGDPLLAGAIAMLGVAGSYAPRRLTRRIGILLVVYAALTALTAHVPALGLVSDVGIGLVVASVLLLISGRHDLAPDADEVRVSLSSIGIDVASLSPVDADARGSVPWVGTTTDGRRIFVKALGRDERSADLMFRAYRWLRYRKTGDHRPFVSLRRAVEHEALVSLQAAALGVRTPQILGVAEAGIDGMTLVYEEVEGRSADRFDDIDDEALDGIWAMVGELHRHRIAHRDLRLANILVADDGSPWLVDFGFSELAASDQLLGTDVAELLASTAAVVGTERAVAAAHRVTGLDELSRALPWLQPSALSTATRQAIGGDEGLAPIRTMLVEQCGVPAEDPVKLERVDGKTLFIFVTIALSAWFLIPQLADVDDIWDEVESASVGWALGAVAFSIATYVAATASLLGAIPLRLRFLPALAAQLASSFANRVTPAKVGGVATNVRYFQQNGVPTAVAATAVGLNAVAGVVVHVSLTVVFLLLSSDDEMSGGLPVPSPATVAVALVIAALVLGVSTALPASRRLLVAHVLPQLQAGWASIRTIAHQPTRLTMLFGGSTAITLSYMAAMIASLEAFGSTASVPIVGLLFLTGSAVANAAPTPGGLGAAEAALIAALSTVEEAQIVIPAVFLYRLVTFWLPILPGWLALTWLRSTDRI